MARPTDVSAQHKLKLGLKLAALAAALLGVYLAGDAAQQYVRHHIGAPEHPWTDPRVLASTAAFIVMLALPYVPGMEVSVALLVVLGAAGAPLVYAATLVALSLSFAAGRLVPAAALAGALRWLHLERAHTLLQRLQPLSPDQKLDLLVRSAPARWVPFLLRHRYIALAIVLNLPGNALVGGGGGIGMAAGLSGLFRYPAYLLAIAIAAAPIPLAVWLGAMSLK